jgi:protoheme IX farnesyltransferase
VTVSAPSALSDGPRSDARGASGLRRTIEVCVDIVRLAKPRITGMVLLTAFGGYWLATRVHGGQRSLRAMIMLLAGTALVVGGANALNMYLERDTDALMDRTRDRPLPAGRLRPEIALAFGLVLAAIAVPMLTFAVNATTGMLGAVALVTYVLLYTPLKRKTTLSLPIGAVPGAIPPLLGWTAATGRIDLLGMALFAVLFLWQIPHFLAIATFRREDYQRAGLKILPVERGDRVTRWHIVAYLTALVGTTLLLEPVGGVAYVATALVLGMGFLGLGLYGLRRSAGRVWARWLFATSIVYLVVLLAALMIAA